MDRNFYRILEKNNLFFNSIIKDNKCWKERIQMHTALQYINNSYIQLENNYFGKFEVMYSIGIMKLNKLLKKL